MLTTVIYEDQNVLIFNFKGKKFIRTKIETHWTWT